MRRSIHIIVILGIAAGFALPQECEAQECASRNTGLKIHAWLATQFTESNPNIVSGYCREGVGDETQGVQTISLGIVITGLPGKLYRPVNVRDVNQGLVLRPTWQPNSAKYADQEIGSEYGLTGNPEGKIHSDSGIGNEATREKPFPVAEAVQDPDQQPLLKMADIRMGEKSGPCESVRWLAWMLLGAMLGMASHVWLQRMDHDRFGKFGAVKPIAILKRRFASGAITEAEFQRIRKDLEK